LILTGIFPDAGDTGGVDISATGGSVQLKANTGIGTSGNLIETQIGTLAAQTTTSGGVFITETDGLTIGSAGSLNGITTASSGEVVLSASERPERSPATAAPLLSALKTTSRSGMPAALR